MNDDSAVPAAAVDIAARAAKAARLLVLDLGWTCGDHHLDMVATAGEDTLVVAEVRAVAHSEAGACNAALAEPRLGQALDAGRAWISQHGTCHRELWAVVVTTDPDGGMAAVAGISARAEVG
jgi:hypothetical protein